MAMLANRCDQRVPEPQQVGAGCRRTVRWIQAGRRRRCLVPLAKDVRAETLFPTLVSFVLGETGLPWD